MSKNPVKVNLDMNNKISTEDLHDLLKSQVQTLISNPSMAGKLPPLFVWGAPGIGKSTILKGVADELGIGFIDVRLAQREPVDIRCHERCPYFEPATIFLGH